MWYDVMLAEVDQNSINLKNYRYIPPDPRFSNLDVVKPDKKIEYKDNFSKRFSNLEVD